MIYCGRTDLARLVLEDLMHETGFVVLAGEKGSRKMVLSADVY